MLVVCRRTILRESGYPRYLHSSVLLGGTLLIFGGNTHNDTSLSNGAKCFSADFLAYDIGLCWYFATPLTYATVEKLEVGKIFNVLEGNSLCSNNITVYFFNISISFKNLNF